MHYGEITFIGDNNERIEADATMHLTRQHTIVATALTGRAGSVKEYVQAEDWQIDITLTAGIAYPDDTPTYRNYPHDTISRIMDFFQRNAHQAIKVQSDYLQLFGIEMIVVQSQSIEQSTHSNKQQIVLSCLSDTPYEIQATE